MGYLRKKGSMNHKVLVANRSAIASRVFRTCKKMGLKTVAIYAANDKEQAFVSEADESFCLGEGALAETYLNQKKILEIIKQCQADLIHPGYGLLSENAEFARAVEDAGKIFIGPSADSIRVMGDKAQSKEICKKIGVPLIPGFFDKNADTQKLKQAAEKIGTPLLIKAVAGGGGKGMRPVYQLEDFDNLLSQTMREAKAAFGKEDVLIEKWIDGPRHVEIQVLADHHGEILSLGERDCSLQRRFQKIIEEGPSPFLDSELRAKMSAEAIRLCKEISYTNAGTVEFIVDDEKNFYFLEMNTRLQVEHAVTECLAGLDLVEWQLRIALGEKLPTTPPILSGHALECRIYAEDPWNQFFPQTGTIRRVGCPASADARLETSFCDGNEVGIDYDPMLAKVIVKGETRAQCIELMKQELWNVSFLGVKTNHAYLENILNSGFFIQGRYHTKTLEDQQELLLKKRTVEQIEFIGHTGAYFFEYLRGRK